MAVGWRFTTTTNGGQSVMIVGALLMPLLLVDKWDLWLWVPVTVLALALEHFLRVSGWMMCPAMGQSHSLLTAVMLVLGSITAATGRMLELFVQMVSWDAMTLVLVLVIIYFLPLRNEAILRFTMYPSQH